MNERFALDRLNRRLMGVCSGIARWTHADPTLVRAGAVVLTLVAGPAALLAYVVAGMVAEAR
jgi:phage shock protein C